MRESILELALCLLIGLASLAVVVWDVATGRIVYLDGITVALLSLTVGGFFMFDVFWSWRSSELKVLLAEMRKPKESGAGAASAKDPAA